MIILVYHVKRDYTMNLSFTFQTIFGYGLKSHTVCYFLIEKKVRVFYNGRGILLLINRKIKRDMK